MAELSDARRRPVPRPLHGVRRAELWVVGSAAVFAATFAAVAAAAGGPAVWDHIERLRLPVLAGLLGLSLVNYALRLARWEVFTRRLGLPVPALNNAVYYVAGFAMTVTPGKVGEALRLWLLRRGHGCRYEHGAGLLIADRLSDAGALMLLCLLGLSAFAGQAWTAAVAALVISLLTLLFLRPGAMLALVGWAYGRLGRWPRLFARLRTALRHTGRLGSWRVYGGTLALATLGWLAEATALHWLLVEFGVPVALEQSVFVFTFAMLAGTAAMLPGGLGGTEVSMVGLLAAVGVGLDAAIAATAVVRITTLWFAVALGFLVLPLALRLVERTSFAKGAAP